MSNLNIPVSKTLFPSTTCAEAINIMKAGKDSQLAVVDASGYFDIFR